MESTISTDPRYRDGHKDSTRGFLSNIFMAYVETQSLIKQKPSLTEPLNQLFENAT